MASPTEIPKPIKSGTTDRPDAPQAGVPAAPPVPAGFSDEPPTPAGFSDTAAPSLTRSTVDGQTPTEDQRSFGDILSDAGARLKQAWDRNLPLVSGPAATLQGVTNLVHSGVDTARGMYESLKPPQGAADWATMAIGGPMFPMLRGIPGLAKQSTQVPGAVSDINASPDPAGTYLKAGGEMASDAAIQALIGAATQGAVNRFIPRPVAPINVRVPGEIAPEAVRPRAYVARPAAPIPPRSGLMLPGEVTPNPAYANVDAIRAKLTAVPRESWGLGELPPVSSSPADALATVGNAGEKQALRKFVSSNPSALSRLPRPVEAGPSGGEGSTPSTLKRVNQTSAEASVKPGIAKVEAPTVKPVATSGVEPAFRAVSTDMSQADLVKLAKRYGIKTNTAAIGRKAGPYSLGRQELVEQIIESADPADLAEITRTLEMRGPGIKPVGGGSGPTPESRAASDAAFKRNFPSEKMPENWGIDFGPREKPLETDPFANATEQARKALGPSASTKDVISLRNKMVGDLPETRDVGARVRAKNPEPTRAEMQAAEKAKSLRKEKE